MDYTIGADESVSTAVVRAVSVVEGNRPDSLRPLTQVLDPNALDDLFDAQAGVESRTGGHLSFVYSNCRVTVDNGEYLTIEPLEYRSRVPVDPETTGEEASRTVR